MGVPAPCPPMTRQTSRLYSLSRTASKHARQHVRVQPVGPVHGEGRYIEKWYANLCYPLFTFQHCLGSSIISNCHVMSTPLCTKRVSRFTNGCGVPVCKSSFIIDVFAVRRFGFAAGLQSTCLHLFRGCSNVGGVA